MNNATKLLSGLLMILLILTLESCTRIQAGYEGIRIQQYGTGKGVQDVTIATGRVWYNPATEDIEEMPLFVQTIDYPPFTLNSKDGSQFTVDPKISIKVIPGSAPKIYVKYRRDVDEIIKTTILTYVQNSFRLVFNEYTVDEVIGKRKEFEAAVEKELMAQLVVEGFQMEQMTSGLAYPESITKAVDLKNQAVQKAQEVENKLKIAEAEAKIKRVEVEMEAETNRLKTATLTPMLIQQQFIDKWDGHTPLYGNAPVLFQNVNH